GRPTIYTEKLGIEICEWIANNSGGLRAGCSQHDHWPEYTVIRRWLREDKFPEFSHLYARAKEEQAETMGEDIILIADNKGADPNDKRVRIDARKWLMGKLKPKKYGDTLTHDFSGPMKIKVNIVK
ncbi:MAG: hypothetical protein KGI54_18380, partial [Pseudomonadota bacterium]|nr:hypothetical protein [Pseudomonadota bacterium]